MRPGARAGGLSTPGGGGGCLGRDNTLEQDVTMARMDSPTSWPRGMVLPASWRHSSIVTKLSTGNVCLGMASSFRGPAVINDGIFLCRNLTVAATNISPCSLIMSLNHFSRFKYSRLLASIAKSITNGKGCPFSIILRAFKSWATSRILDSLECSLSPS